MSSFIPKSFINDLLARCNIVDLINQFVSLKKQGSNYTARCPFHEDSTPSFSVSETKQMYHCFGCGVGGNAISFVIAYEKLDFVSAIEWLANHFQLEIPKSRPALSSSKQLPTLYSALGDAVSFYQKQLHNYPKAMEYLSQRGISKNSVEQFSIGYAPTGWDALVKWLSKTHQYDIETLQTVGLIIKKSSTQVYDRFRSRIIFPIRDRQGRFIGLGGRVLHTANEPKYLNSPETPIFYKSKELYGLYESHLSAKEAERIWVVEGYLDVITLSQFNISPVVATLGTATSVSHLHQLFRLTKEVVFCFDGDTAGKKAAVRALELSLQQIEDDWSIRFLLLPDGEDPDSWIRQSTVKDITHLLNQTLSFEDFLFQYIQQGVNLSSAEGQRQLLKKAVPLIKKMPHNIRRIQLFQQLSRLSHIEVDQLETLYTKPFTPKRVATTQTVRAYTVLDRAISLLLQYPEQLRLHLSGVINDEFQAEYPLLSDVIRVVQHINEPHTAIVLEQFRDNPDTVRHLLQLSEYHCLVPDDGVLAEFTDSLIHLRKSSRDRKVKRLIQKARQSVLTSEESTQLERLIRERDKP